MKKLLKIILVVVIVLVIGVVAGVGFLTVREYKPEDIETVECYGTSSKEIAPGDSVTVLTYNIGYGANDAQHDFFMDGGKTVTTESVDNINNNMEGIIDTIYAANADVTFLQEVDIDSKRSHHVDEANLLANAFPETNHAFANNFLCDYIPYPLHDNIGKVNSGLMTINSFETSTVERIALSESFTWPVSTCQLKRCLLVERVPLTNSTKELVLVNLHLEAYDSGEGKMTQFKELCEFIQLEFAKGNYVIAGGDFNAILPSVNASKYPLTITENFEPATIPNDMLTGGWKYCTDDTTPTSRLLNEIYDPTSETTQLYVIDGFICSPNTIIEATLTIDKEFKHSDHNPVMVKVNLVK